MPGDLAVIGYDDIELARYTGLTTVAQPLDESGALGAELLLAALEGAPASGRQLTVELVVRDTTGPPSTNRGCSQRNRKAAVKDRRRQTSPDGISVRS